nr:MAG TPA: hypothetical protein [Caudoviricetes sp.]
MKTVISVCDVLYQSITLYMLSLFSVTFHNKR